MNKRELIYALKDVGDEEIVVVSDDEGGWDNIEKVGVVGGTAAIFFGGGSPFSGDK